MLAGGAQLKTRIIADTDFNDYRVALNAIFSEDTTGGEASSQVRGRVAAGVYWRPFFNLQPGARILRRLRRGREIPSFDEQHHTVFATVDWRWSKNWVWHLGVGRGLTSASDNSW